MFFCAISGTPPTHPVISTKSGNLFDRALIEKYIDENARDPISGEALAKEDLVEVKVSPNVTAPRPSAATSVPALLHSLQSEWDSLMLESLALKQQYQSTRQELAHALYREDASLRVVARLVKERDQAREALASVQSTLGVTPAAEGAAPAAGDVEMEASTEPAEGDLPSAVKATLEATHKALSSVRKKRKTPPGYADAATVSGYTQTLDIPSLHAAKPPGVTALDVSADGNLLLTGGADKLVQIYDRSSEKVVASLKGHTKKVSSVAFREAEGKPSLALSAAADGKVKIFAESEGSWLAAHTVAVSKKEVSSLILHPSKGLAAAASVDSTWSLLDLERGEIVQTYEALSSDDGSYAYSSFAVHPDGLLHGGGTADGSVRIWDVRDRSALAATLSNESGAAVPALSFSENGYHLAVANGASSSVGIFDLRKLSQIHTIALPTASAPGGGKIHSVRFDPSGQFLSVAGTDLRVFKNKTWEEALLFDGNAGELTEARFAKNGAEIVLSGMDRTVRVLSAAAA